MTAIERTISDSLSASDALSQAYFHTTLNVGRDGRRRSNPLTSLDTAPAKAPDWQLSRVVSAQDSVYTKRQAGVNAGGFSSLRFAVTPMTADPRVDPEAVPGGTQSPATEIRIWSEPAQAFVSLPTAITHAGAGAGLPYVIDVPNANGSILACFVTNAITGVVAIASQGFNTEDM